MIGTLVLGWDYTPGDVYLGLLLDTSNVYEIYHDSIITGFGFEPTASAAYTRINMNEYIPQEDDINTYGFHSVSTPTDPPWDILIANVPKEEYETHYSNAITNHYQIEFPVATYDWGTFSHMFLTGNSEIGEGDYNIIATLKFQTGYNPTILAGQKLVIPPGGLSISTGKIGGDPDSMMFDEEKLAEKLDYFFNKIYYPPSQKNMYLSYGNLQTGTEVSASSGFKRQLFSPGDWTESMYHFENNNGVSIIIPDGVLIDLNNANDFWNYDYYNHQFDILLLYADSAEIGTPYESVAWIEQMTAKHMIYTGDTIQYSYADLYKKDHTS